MKFSLKYFILTVIIFTIEVLIATVFKDIVFVRSYLGDVLVVILIYTSILSFFEISNKLKLIVGIFIFSCIIEVLQYLHFGEILGLKDNKIAMIVLGNSFSWVDIVCYFAGCVIVWVFEFKPKKMTG